MRNNEFYIGWMPAAPASFSKHLKKVIAALAAFFILMGVMLALLQKQFSLAVFEFGKLTELQGVYFDSPFPALKVVKGKDVLGRDQHTTILLVAYGKLGARGIVRQLEAEANTKLNGKQVTLRGTLLYSEGRMLMQLDQNDKPLLGLSGNSTAAIPSRTELGTITLKGEIVDPKCYFGVMKPGQGKPHKDCAIRCILGGIPPVLRVPTAEGRNNFYLLAGTSININKAVQDFVAEPVTITAHAVQQDDWTILYVDNATPIRRISRRDVIRPAGAAVLCAAP